LSEQAIQLAVFCFVLGAIALITYIKCTGENRHSTDSNKEYFLAGGGLTWVFVAGSITLTNLSTDQLVGMNGNQMLLLAIWELAGFVGLMVLAKVFLPVYYRNNCTTTTELWSDATIANMFGHWSPPCSFLLMYLFSSLR